MYGIESYFTMDPYRLSRPELLTFPKENNEEENKIEAKIEVEDNKNNLIENFKNRLSLILLTLNPRNEYFFPDEDPLESGLLFAVLLRKFSQMLENSRIDNLILTEIWLTIASLPLDKTRPETFYLYAFCFQVCNMKQNNELKSNIGLFNTIENIQKDILYQQRIEEEDMDCILYHRK